MLVITPLPLEYQALKAAFGIPISFNSFGKLNVDIYDGLALTIGGQGKVQFALTTQFLIEHIRPSLVICAGACGALDPNLKLMDLVAAKNTIEHDYNVKFVSRPLPRFPGDANSLKKLEAFPELSIGDIASGDEDVIDATRVQSLRDTTGAMAVAWEGAGGARACRFSQTPYLELRVVTDTCDRKSVADFAKNASTGMVRIKDALLALKS